MSYRFHGGRRYSAWPPQSRFSIERYSIAMVHPIEKTPNLPGESREDGLRFALPASYAADVGWIYSELAGNAVVEPAKERSKLRKGRAIIRCHDS